MTVTASYSSKSAEYRAFDNATRTLAKEKFGVEYEGPVNNFVANFHDAVSFSCRLSNVFLVVEFAIFGSKDMPNFEFLKIKYLLSFEVNSVQEACAKCLAVHIRPFNLHLDF